MDKKKRFDRICREIKSIKIQGARQVAKAGLMAYKLLPSEKTKNKILSLRPTEPFLVNALKSADEISYNDFLKQLNYSQQIINKETLKLIRKNFVVFTHCHSSTVTSALIYAKRNGKKFEVFLTETRPLYQGRKTAKELRKAGIKVTMFVDSAASIALTKSQDTRDVDLVLFGTDAITKKGVVNKVGSGMFAQIARADKIPVYILADSLKYIKKVKLEKRGSEEVWGSKKIKIINPAFELIKRKYINGIISEFGLLSYKQFLKRVKS